MHIDKESLAGLAGAVGRREVSPVELVQSALASIDEANGELRAFITVAHERALDQARAAEAAVMRGEKTGPLHGVPIAVKDLMETADMPTTYGFLRFQSNLPDSDCVAVQRLRAAGAIVVGKTNTPAMGMLGETKNRLGPPCRNPWDPARGPGGSSGGSAAAVAAGLVLGATGTDSAGSITAPASVCGVFGIKPTHGRVPTVPVPDDSLFLLDNGPLTRSVGDAALMLGVMSGYDERDPIAIREPAQDYASALREPAGSRPLAGLRVAFSEDLGHFAVDAEIRDRVRHVAARLAGLGAEVEAAHPRMEDPMAVYMPVYVPDVERAIRVVLEGDTSELYPESLSELAEYGSQPAERYVGALHRMWGLRAAVDTFFERYDLLLTPGTATVAFPHDTPPSVIGGREVAPTWMTIMPFQVTWNLTGLPVAALPAGLSQERLPIGCLLAGRRGAEATLLRASRAWEEAEPWGARTPPGVRLRQA